MGSPNGGSRIDSSTGPQSRSWLSGSVGRQVAPFTPHHNGLAPLEDRNEADELGDDLRRFDSVVGGSNVAGRCRSSAPRHVGRCWTPRPDVVVTMSTGVGTSPLRLSGDPVLSTDRRWTSGHVGTTISPCHHRAEEGL